LLIFFVDKINQQKENSKMTSQLSQIQWGRVILTALVVYVLSFVTVFLIVTGYASYLAFQARGAPDQAMINTFANQYAPWVGSISVILFTFLGARWMARRVGTATEIHGIVLGVLVSLVNIIFDGVSLNSLLTLILTIAAGWLGTRSSARS
jgi:hypothetical protein